MFSDFAALAKLGFAPWTPGAHACPWKPRMYTSGAAVMVIAPNGCPWGYHEAPAFSDGEGRMEYDYTEHEAIERGTYGRLLRIEAQYKQDRAEYGRLIGLGLHAPGAEPTD